MQKHEVEILVLQNREIVYRFPMTADGNTPNEAIDSAIAMYSRAIRHSTWTKDCLVWGWYNKPYVPINRTFTDS
jgi:hypothetical protein